MKPAYHRAITEQALHAFLPPETLNIILRANLGQDALRYQIGHDHFHYDNNAFAAADAYVEQMRQSARRAFQRGESDQAWQFFGRLTHTVQDFYAHSDYVARWREQTPGGEPAQIPAYPASGFEGNLRSGRLYYPLEILSFLPPLRPLILPLLPRNSHAWMNLDDPGQPNFDFAFAAAVKHTALEYHQIESYNQPHGHKNSTD
ncbi:MAG: hypothetical protein CO094_04235 [Anaerolineae bacterium CG_4_9_14_3_um_filter_57_17]|nr:hypothetical protein [bacterium]NCT21401.1 hypothetical protein [bacterium]OIO83184.1 MAG: hypothetical protein AUK01_13470 [Anaerolineae bacterium CG2_30_57_67]PJB67406.1 MAG: hypothetical protein CO094_04235 [Anaerolineae bacterium CG_4_9_14_3_um_filter_57_17]